MAQDDYRNHHIASPPQTERPPRAPRNGRDGGSREAAGRDGGSRDAAGKDSKDVTYAAPEAAVSADGAGAACARGAPIGMPDSPDKVRRSGNPARRLGLPAPEQL